MTGIRRTAAWPVLALLAAALLAALVPAPAIAGQTRDVRVPGGVVRGLATPHGFLFQGIPFAAPPTGDRRWRPPAPVEPWRGVRDANRPAPSCLQTLEGWNRDDWLRGQEDCLTLDIASPALAGRRPVMLWIHGGSNRAGSGAGVVRSRLAERGIVLVSIQYRLGLLGFLSHRGLAAEQGGHSGNYGLMDQIAALRWVRANIARFGGDPDRVTIFGESAGAQDVSLLLAAPAARGLFRAAILQSGTPGFGMDFRSLAQGFALGDQLDQMSGSGGDVARLRALSPVALLALQPQLAEPEARGHDFLFLRPTIDGAVLPDAPDRLLARRPPLPVIIGTNSIEFGPQPGSVDLPDFARYWFASRSGAALAAYRDEEVQGADPRRGTIELRMQSDAQFHCPANRLVRLLVSHGWPVWRYEFDHAPDGGLTRHALEISYVMDGHPLVGGVSLQDYWLAFAIGLDPDHRLLPARPRPAWPRLSAGSWQTLRLAEPVSLADGLPRDAFCAFADRY